MNIWHKVKLGKVEIGDYQKYNLHSLMDLCEVMSGQQCPQFTLKVDIMSSWNRLNIGHNHLSGLLEAISDHYIHQPTWKVDQNLNWSRFKHGL